MRGASIALAVYASDNDDRLPVAARWMDLALPQVPKDFDRVDVDDIRMFQCPSVGTATPPPFGFAFNAGLSSMRQADVGSPQTTVLLFESADVRRNASDPLRSLLATSRHGEEGRINVGYVEGHLKNLSPHEARRLRNADR
jgi:hypothetical protein